MDGNVKITKGPYVIFPAKTVASLVRYIRHEKRKKKVIVNDFDSGSKYTLYEINQILHN